MNRRSEGGETLLVEFELTRSVARQWLLISTAGIPISLVLFGGAYGLSTGDFELGFSVASETTGAALLGFALVVFACALVIAVHEAIHGVAMWRFGATPRFGVGIAHVVLPYAYATTDRPLSRTQFLVVALAPLFVITVGGFPVAVALEEPWILLPLAINAAGSIGDLWMAALVLRCPRTVRIVDDGTGLRIYGRPDDRFSNPSGGRVVRAMASAFALVVCLFVLAALLAAPLSRLVGLESFSLGPAGTRWHLLTVESGPDGVAASVGGYAVLAASTFAAALAGIASAIRS